MKYEYKYEVEIGYCGFGWDVVQRFTEGGDLVIATFHSNGAPTAAKLLATEYAALLNQRIKNED